MIPRAPFGDNELGVATMNIERYCPELKDSSRRFIEWLDSLTLKDEEATAPEPEIVGTTMEPNSLNIVGDLPIIKPSLKENDNVRKRTNV